MADSELCWLTVSSDANPFYSENRRFIGACLVYRRLRNADEAARQDPKRW